MALDSSFILPFSSILPLYQWTILYEGPGRRSPSTGLDVCSKRRRCRSNAHGGTRMMHGPSEPGSAVPCASGSCHRRTRGFQITVQRIPARPSFSSSTSPRCLGISVRTYPPSSDPARPACRCRVGFGVVSSGMGAGCYGAVAMCNRPQLPQVAADKNWPMRQATLPPRWSGVDQCSKSRRYRCRGG